MELGDASNAKDRGGRHKYFSLSGHLAQGADDHAAHANEGEHDVVTELFGDGIEKRHAGESGEGEKVANPKTFSIIVELAPELRVLGQPHSPATTARAMRTLEGRQREKMGSHLYAGPS